MNPIHSLHPLARAWLLDGPLSPHVDVYSALLERGSYCEGSSGGYVRALAHFAHWMTRCRLEARQLDETFVDQWVGQSRVRNARPTSVEGAEKKLDHPIGWY